MSDAPLTLSSFLDSLNDSGAQENTQDLSSYEKLLFTKYINKPPQHEDPAKPPLQRLAPGTSAESGYSISMPTAEDPNTEGKDASLSSQELAQEENENDDLLQCYPSSFQCVYESICNRIRKSAALDAIIEDFEKRSSDYERVKYVSEFEEILSLEIGKCGIRKDESVASEFESRYDQLTETSSPTREALRVISRAIGKTPPDLRDNLARRFMKRGWMYLNLEDFDNAYNDCTKSCSLCNCAGAMWNAYEVIAHCHAKRLEYKASEKYFLKALEGLRQSGESNDVKAIATKRMLLVYKNIKGKKPPKEKSRSGQPPAPVPQVDHGCHPVLSSASEAVDVFVTRERGRCLVANRDIKPGDILMVDTPYAYMLNEESSEDHCYYCLKKIESCLPCPTCDQVWFCNKECLRRGLEEVHSTECPIMPYLTDNVLGKMGHLVFRILMKRPWKAWKKMKNALLKELKTGSEIVKKAKNKVQLVMDTGRIPWNWEGKYDSHDYSTVFHLVTNSNHRSFGDLFKRSLGATYIGHCLKAIGFLGKDPTVEDFLYVASLALHHLQSCSCNAYEISEITVGGDGITRSTISEVGGAVYPTISLTNHGCYPNVARYSAGRNCILRATRTIPKDTEILDNYGYNFHSLSLVQRQHSLLHQYKFTCMCDACTSDWPPYPHKQGENFFFFCPDPKCGQPASYMEGRRDECTMCGNKHKYGKLVAEVTQEVMIQRKALELLRDQKYPEALQLLLHHQCFLDRVSVPPMKHLTDTQESIKMCFYLYGNVVLKI